MTPKKSHCSLCGNNQPLTDVTERGHQVICISCEMCAAREESYEEAIESWNKLNARFPSAWRAKAGDEIIYQESEWDDDGNECGESHHAIIESIERDTDSGVSILNVRWINDTIDPEDNPIYTHQVTTWPWEMENTKNEQ